MAKGKNKSGRYAGIPHRVMDHPDYIQLSLNARALLLELAYQYTGFNNGDLSIVFRMLKNRGFKSEHPVNNAKKELLESGMITLTRQGGFTQSACSLFALSWLPIHECNGKLDVKPTKKPYRTFLKTESRMLNQQPVDADSTSKVIKLERNRTRKKRYKC